MKVDRIFSTEEVEEPLGFSTVWTKPEEEYLISGASFSAICLMFGEQLHDDLDGTQSPLLVNCHRVFKPGMPIGLIDSSWGGTIVEAWSPPEALAACDVTDNGIGEENNHNEYLWNGMIYPLLKMTIRYVMKFFD